MALGDFGSEIIDSANQIRYAKYFSFKKFSKGTLVFLTDPANKTDTLQILFLGKDKPKNLDPSVTYLKTPLTKIGCLSSVFVAFTDALGKSESIVAVDEFDYICSGKIRDRILQNKLEEISAGNSFNFEKALKINPEAIFLYSVPGAEDPAVSKMKKLGLKVVLCQNYLEQHPLGRAEWIKFFGLLFSEEQLAQNYFEEVSEHYNTYSQAALEQNIKPEVFMYAPYNNIWNISGGNSFASHFMADAGSQYCFSDDTGSANRNMQFESVFDVISNADYWLIPNDIKSIAELSNADSRYNLFKSVINNQVYNCDKWTNNLGGNMFWEYGVVRPDIILADLIKIFHPELMTNHTFVFFRKLE